MWLLQRLQNANDTAARFAYKLEINLPDIAICRQPFLLLGQSIINIIRASMFRHGCLRSRIDAVILLISWAISEYILSPVTNLCDFNYFKLSTSKGPADLANPGLRYISTGLIGELQAIMSVCFYNNYYFSAICSHSCRDSQARVHSDNINWYRTLL